MTAVEADLSLPVIVWNNSALGQIRDDMVVIARLSMVGMQRRRGGPGTGTRAA